MLDHALDELLLAHLKTVPALAALHGYTGQDNADHKLPALTIGTTFHMIQFTQSNPATRISRHGASRALHRHRGTNPRRARRTGGRFPACLPARCAAARGAGPGRPPSANQ